MKKIEASIELPTSLIVIVGIWWLLLLIVGLIFVDSSIHFIIAYFIAFILTLIIASLPTKSIHPRCPKCKKWTYGEYENIKYIDKYEYEKYYKCKYCGAMWVTEGDDLGPYF